MILVALLISPACPAVAEDALPAPLVHPPANDPMRREWGYTAGDAERLFGSSVRRGGIRRGHSRESILEGTYWDFRPLVTSDTLFAYQRDTKKLSWRYDPQDQVILNPTITLGGGRIYFLQVTAPQGEETGRIRIDKALDLEARLVALDAESGELVWEHAVAYAAIEHHLYALYQNPILVTVGSRNQATGEQDKDEQDKDEVWYDLHAYDANTENLLWEQSQNNRTDAGGDHGEQGPPPGPGRQPSLCRAVCLRPAERKATARLAVAAGTPAWLRNGLGIGKRFFLSRFECGNVRPQGPNTLPGHPSESTRLLDQYVPGRGLAAGARGKFRLHLQFRTANLHGVSSRSRRARSQKQ